MVVILTKQQWWCNLVDPGTDVINIYTCVVDVYSPNSFFFRDYNCKLCMINQCATGILSNHTLQQLFGVAQLLSACPESKNVDSETGMFRLFGEIHRDGVIKPGLSRSYRDARDPYACCTVVVENCLWLNNVYMSNCVLFLINHHNRQ